MTLDTLAADEKAIRELDTAWGDAATRHDVATVVSFYAADGSLVWPDMPAVHGTADVTTSWTQMIESTPGLGLRFAPERITVSASGDLATDFGVVYLSMDGPDGTRINDVGKYVVTWQKVNGEWKVLYDVWNANQKGS